mgnify:CR=1 FL=1
MLPTLLILHHRFSSHIFQQLGLPKMESSNLFAIADNCALQKYPLVKLCRCELEWTNYRSNEQYRVQKS